MSALLGALGALLVSSSAAEPYFSVDAALAYRTGRFRWASPPLISPGLGWVDPTPVVADGRVSAVGVMVDGAGGYTLRSAVSIAAEAGLGVLGSASSNLGWSNISFIAHLRFGCRLEFRFGYTFYARTSYGLESLLYMLETLDIGARDNVVQREMMIGPYAALTHGLRMKNLGLFVRGELGRVTSTHATFTPMTFAVGADVTWF